MNESASNPTTVTSRTPVGPAATAGTPGEGTPKAAPWVNGISYWQDYMTIIELDDFAGPGLRSAS